MMFNIIVYLSFCIFIVKSSAALLLLGMFRGNLRVLSIYIESQSLVLVLPFFVLSGSWFGWAVLFERMGCCNPALKLLEVLATLESVESFVVLVEEAINQLSLRTRSLEC